MVGNSSHFILRTRGLESSGRAAVLHVSCIAASVRRHTVKRDHSLEGGLFFLVTCVNILQNLISFDATVFYDC